MTDNRPATRERWVLPRRRRVPRMVWPVLVVVVGLIALVVYLVSRPSDYATRVENYEGYTVNADGRSITVHLVLGSGDVIGAVDVDETDAQVRIDIDMRSPLGARPAVGIPTDVAVPLAEPLGDRSVQAWDGTGIPRRG